MEHSINLFIGWAVNLGLSKPLLFNNYQTNNDLTKMISGVISSLGDVVEVKQIIYGLGTLIIAILIYSYVNTPFFEQLDIKTLIHNIMKLFIIFILLSLMILVVYYCCLN